MQKTLVRLSNNDRIIGHLVYATRDMVALYAPMLITCVDDIFETKEDEAVYHFTRYDELSDSCLAIFDMMHVLTCNYPKSEITDFYDKFWKEHYPNFEDYKNGFMEEKGIKTKEEDFNEEKLNDLFSEFLKGTNVDKSKLN